AAAGDGRVVLERLAQLLLEARGDAAELAQRPADLARAVGQPLGPEDDERDQQDHEQLTAADVEHVDECRRRPARDQGSGPVPWRWRNSVARTSVSRSIACTACRGRRSSPRRRRSAAAPAASSSIARARAATTAVATAAATTGTAQRRRTARPEGRGGRRSAAAAVGGEQVLDPPVAGEGLVEVDEVVVGEGPAGGPLLLQLGGGAPDLEAAPGRDQQVDRGAVGGADDGARAGRAAEHVGAGLGVLAQADDQLSGAQLDVSTGAAGGSDQGRHDSPSGGSTR